VGALRSVKTMNGNTLWRLRSRPHTERGAGGEATGYEPKEVGCSPVNTRYVSMNLTTLARNEMYDTYAPYGRA
jgi:hypothetical protein